MFTQRQLEERNAEISELQSSVDRLQCQTPDTTNLLATIESDKVAASRAVSQNQQLKMQLDEIQKAFVQLVGYTDSRKSVFVHRLIEKYVLTNFLSQLCTLILLSQVLTQVAAFA